MSDFAIAAAGGGVVLLLVELARAVAARGRSRTAKRRARIARNGELAAVDLLVDAGFAIETAQATHAWSLTVDGEPREAALRCDYLATRDGERWVAEVKTGEDAPRLTNAATRRQLLEYQVAYRAAGVALIDATAGVIHEVSFDLGPGPSAPTAARWPLFAAGFVLGVATVLLALQT